MEATREVEDLFTKIRPPREEDAGLEDCALPPESIKEAFLKAASAVGSRPFLFHESDEESDDEPSEGCVADPWPEAKESSDKLMEISDGIEPTSDKMLEISDGIEVKEACVDGLKGLTIGERKKSKKKKDEDEEEGPTLVEGYI